MEILMEENKRSEPTEVSENEPILFQWNHSIRMLFNPVLWGSFALCFGIPAILLGIGFSFTGDLKVAVLFPAALLAFFVVIWVIVGIVIDLGGGFFSSFTITSKGIYFASGPAARKAADAVTITGVLTGSALRTGAGLLAREEQDSFIAWEEIKKVSVRKEMRYISVRSGFGIKPIGMYCNQENFEPVLKLVQSKFKR